MFLYEKNIHRKNECSSTDTLIFEFENKPTLFFIYIYIYIYIATKDRRSVSRGMVCKCMLTHGFGNPVSYILIRAI
jgi:hypothetical protein